MKNAIITNIKQCRSELPLNVTSLMNISSEVKQWKHVGLIREDQGSTPGSGYPGLGFPCFPEIAPGECWDCYLTYAMAT